MMRKITPFIIAAICLLAIQSFAQDSRLLGYNTIRFNNGNWEPYDTARFVYNPGNLMPTPVTTYNDVIKYDTSYLSGWTGTQYVDGYMKVKTYNTAGNCTERIEYNLYPTVSLNKKFTFTYTGNNDLQEELGQHWNSGVWENDYHTTKTYNGNHDMLTETTAYWAGTQWGNPYLFVYTYDGNHNMTSYVNTSYNTGTSQFDSTYRHEHFYHIGNLTDSSRSYEWNSGWQLNGHTVYYYGVNNVNMGYLSQSLVSGNWVNSGQGFTIVDVNNVPVGDSNQIWNTTNSVWDEYYRSHSILDVNNNRLVTKYDIWNTTISAWEDDFLDSIAYNTHDQYTWYKRISWDALNMTWGQYNDQISHYYYEEYTANNVSNTTSNAGILVLYPVPARNNLNINMQWNKAEDFTIAIYDIQGRLVRQFGEKATKNFTKNIPLNGLPAGTYILKIRGKDATVQEQFVIMD